jgi:hypothetical protein
MRKPDIELSWAHPRAWLAEESDSSRSFLGTAIVAGFLQICTARFWPSSDGNSYLETATANLNSRLEKRSERSLESILLLVLALPASHPCSVLATASVTGFR